MARTAVFILLLLVHRIVAAGGEQVIPLARLNRIDDANTHNMPVNDVLGLAGAHQWSPVLLLDSIRLKNEERKKERKTISKVGTVTWKMWELVSRRICFTLDV